LNVKRIPETARIHYSGTLRSSNGAFLGRMDEGLLLASKSWSLGGYGMADKEPTVWLTSVVKYGEKSICLRLGQPHIDYAPMWKHFWSFARFTKNLLYA
jgi:hypothetical protein